MKYFSPHAIVFTPAHTRGENLVKNINLFSPKGGAALYPGRPLWRLGKVR